MRGDDRKPTGDEQRIRELAADARRARVRADATDQQDQSPRACATEAARDGLGPVIALYVEARAGDHSGFSATEMDQLHRATSDWLAVYAACYGVEIEPDVTVREAAEVFIDTHNVRETAALLTQVP